MDMMKIFEWARLGVDRLHTENLAEIEEAVKQELQRRKGGHAAQHDGNGQFAGKATRDAVLRFIKANSPVTAAQVAAHFGNSYQAAMNTLSRMTTEGVTVRVKKGTYALSEAMRLSEDILKKVDEEPAAEERRADVLL